MLSPASRGCCRHACVLARNPARRFPLDLTSKSGTGLMSRRRYKSSHAASSSSSSGHSTAAASVVSRPLFGSGARRQLGISVNRRILPTTTPPSSGSLVTTTTTRTATRRRHLLQRRPATTAIKTTNPGSTTTTTAPRVVGTPLRKPLSVAGGVRNAANRTSTTASRADLWNESRQRRNLLDILDELLRKPRTIPIPRWITPQQVTITYSELMGHASFVLVAVSYAVDDFLMLRVLAVAGSTVMLFFTYFHPHGRVLWLPFKWNVLFIVLNSYRIGKIYLDQYRASQLPQELIECRRRNYYLMSPVSFARLVRLGTVKEYRKGDVITMQGECNRYVRLVLTGRIRVLRDGKLNYMLEEGSFISETGLHVGLLLPGNVESPCTLVVDEDARLLTWDRTELVELLEHDSELLRSLKAALSWDIIRKLKDQRSLVTQHLIDEPEEWTERRTAQTQHRYAAILHNILSHRETLRTFRRELDKYRMIHHIDDEHHAMALRAIGWTVEEFETGKRARAHHHDHVGDDSHDHVDDEADISDMDNFEHLDEDPDEIKHDWRWYLQHIYVRVFG